MAWRAEFFRQKTSWKENPLFFCSSYNPRFVPHRFWFLLSFLFNHFLSISASFVKRSFVFLSGGSENRRAYMWSGGKNMRISIRGRKRRRSTHANTFNWSVDRLYKKDVYKLPIGVKGQFIDGTFFPARNFLPNQNVWINVFDLAFLRFGIR